MVIRATANPRSLHSNKQQQQAGCKHWRKQVIHAHLLLLASPVARLLRTSVDTRLLRRTGEVAALPGASASDLSSLALSDLSPCSHVLALRLVQHALLQ